MNDNNNEETVIDLSQLFGAVRKSIVSIIIWGIAGLLVSLFATFVLMTPKYSSTIDILVNQKADNTQMQYTAQQAELSRIRRYFAESDGDYEPDQLTGAERDRNRHECLYGRRSCQYDRQGLR